MTSKSFATAGSGQRNFAAFKVLPVDPNRGRRQGSSMSDGYADLSDEMQGASTCKEAVDLIVERIYNACHDVGGAQGDFISEEDIVRSVMSKPSICRSVCSLHQHLHQPSRGSAID